LVDWASWFLKILTKIIFKNLLGLLLGTFQNRIPTRLKGIKARIGRRLEDLFLIPGF